MKWARRFFSYLLDHPSAVTCSLIGLVVLQWLLSWLWLPSLSPLQWTLDVPEADRPDAFASLATGVAGVAAMVGGFAGVVVVFGLSSNDERFRQVRIKASTSLRRNWTSIVTTPLFAAFGAMGAAALATSRHETMSLWVLEGCVLLAAHGAVRLVVLLSALVKVVHASDEQIESPPEGVIRTDEFYD
ncbi:hypothetical protein [Microbacterium sp. NPDC058389]|uniref:hypothetical protein n=1 Tax=Microbacterium sp. NPDC058389 TaxID=3346475 RepID=UPI00365C4337